MQSAGFIKYACAILLGIAGGIVEAKEILLPYRGLVLNANLELAPGKKAADGVILITHGSLAHRGMESLLNFQSLLNEKGYNTLAINLSLSLDNRRGMYDCQITHRHRYSDAVDEIGVWVDWLKKQGVKRVAVLGHSRGAAQTALYAAERDHVLTKAVILLAPSTLDNASPSEYAERFQQPLAPLLERAQKLVREGKGGTLLEQIGFITCAGATVTATSFVSYYASDTRLDTPALLAKIAKPVLVVVAGGDEIVVGLDTKVAPRADGKRVQMKVVENADHFFRDLYADEAVDAIHLFLKDTGY